MDYTGIIRQDAAPDPEHTASRQTGTLVGLHLHVSQRRNKFGRLSANYAPSICFNSAMRRNDPKQPARSYFRSSARTFQMNGGWYFSTREGDHGPHATKAAAELELARFVRDLRELRGFQKSRESTPAKPRPSAKELSLTRLKEQAAPRRDLALDLPAEPAGLAAQG